VNWSGAVTLGPVSGLPAGATAAITPSSTSGSSAALTITTSNSTPAGLYTLVVSGSAVLSGNTKTTRYAAFTLNVLPPFAISGNLASPLALGAGAARSLDLTLTNPYSTALTARNIQVSLASLQQAAGAGGSCNQTGTNSPNFQITNLPASYAVTIPANTATKLSQLGSGQMPTVSWIDQPWAQNGCLGAKLSFSYSANGQF
jgi:hypothetical protein